MGGYNQNRDSQASSSQASTYESPLSKEQLAILKNRESQYQKYFFPEIVDSLADTNDTTITTPMMAQQASQINSQYKASNKALDQNMAQRGLSGTASGVGAQLAATQERAKTSSLASSYYNTLLSNQEQKMNLLKLGAGVSPTPTTSAEYLQSSQSNSDGSGFQWGFSALK